MDNLSSWAEDINVHTRCIICDDPALQDRWVRCDSCYGWFHIPYKAFRGPCGEVEVLANICIECLEGAD